MSDDTEYTDTVEKSDENGKDEEIVVGLGDCELAPELFKKLAEVADGHERVSNSPQP